MLDTIKAKLRPIFLRRYQSSRLLARRAAHDAGMTEKETELYLSGFEDGWMRGAVDSMAVRAKDVQDHPQVPADPDPSVH
jgi:hypothetical protein